MQYIFLDKKVINITLINKLMLYNLFIPIGLAASTYTCVTSGHSTVEHFNRWKNNNYKADDKHHSWLLTMAGFASLGLLIKIKS